MNRYFTLFTFLISYLYCEATGPYNATFSPYSVYGFGIKSFEYITETASMGGVYSNFNSPSVANINNPSSYSTLDVTSFSFGAHNSLDYFKQNDITASSYSNIVNNFNLAIPILENRLGICFGMYPYSSMGYYNTIYTEIDDSNTRTDILRGFGGLNNIFLGAGYNIFDDFRVGFNINYIFGSVNRYASYSETSLDFISIFSNSSFLSGVNFDFGIQKEYKISDDFILSFGATYKFGNYLKADITNVSYVADKYSIRLDNDSKFEETYDENITVNDEFSFALGVGNIENWNVSVQYDFLNDNTNKDILNYNSNEDFEYTTGNRISFGGFITPSNDMFSNYFLKITYRIGLFMQKQNFSLHNTNIYDRGITLGLSLPLKRASYLNFGIIYGKFGTTENNLIQDTYIKLYLSINFNDRWFIKYKYD